MNQWSKSNDGRENRIFPAKLIVQPDDPYSEPESTKKAKGTQPARQAMAPGSKISSHSDEAFALPPISAKS
ncbi:alpha/beta hydrolase [Aspergillus luchuensis]|uniref:Alpha/beta hydrolase n=1 Tax=Aspergillus kawachii TaxID=1069201 RepID=A0A146EY64_ASPKA|nr:alpha/beta hydrolase [Aspergillus luchuensis]